MNTKLTKCFLCFLVFQLFTMFGLQPAASAARVPTETLINATSYETTRAQLRNIFAREDVQTKLQAMGVDPIAAADRLDELTPAELQQLQGQMDKLPAGADAGLLVVLGIVFVVLIVLELVGVTNIFNRI